MKVDLPVESAVGTLSGERIEMDLDRTAISHLMRVLTKLYEDSELACIREYSTNARDSHIESGQTRPIEVTTPTHMNPVLTIQDWGVGMDIEDLRRTYSQYGASTKRDSDDFNGMLGLGSKSALAYTDQFSLETVKDGILYSVVVFKDAGSPAMKVVDSYETDLPNGVKVMIPAGIYNDMAAKAREFFQYWESGLVLLNGTEPEKVQGIRVSDTFMLVKHEKYEHTPNKVVMGGVAYPTAHFKIEKLKADYHVVASVDMNIVSFTPNREGLELDRKTNKALLALSKQFHQDIADAVQSTLDGAQTVHEAVKGALRFSYALDMIPEVTFQGKKIPDYLHFPRKVRTSGTKSDPLRQNSLVEKVEPLAWNASIWVTGFKLTQFTANHKKKMLKWLEDSGLEATRFLMVEHDTFDDQWIEPQRIVPWKEVQAIKLPSPARKKGIRGATGPGRLQGSYDIEVVEKGREVYKSEVPANDICRKTRQLFYMNPQEYRTGMPRLIRAGYPNATLVIMGMNRMQKFKRDFPLAKYAHDYRVRSFEKWQGRIKRSDFTALALERDHHTRHALERVNIDETLDPEFKSIAKCAKLKSRIDSSMLNTFRYQGFRIDAQELPVFEICEKYPLLKGGYARDANLEHYTLYVNAVWAAEQAKKQA